MDQMSPEQARAVLISGLPPLDPAVVQGLLEVTGRWPLLLRLVSKILADYARVAPDVSGQGPDVSGQGAVLLARLRTGGPAVVDDLVGTLPQDAIAITRRERGAMLVLVTQMNLEGDLIPRALAACPETGGHERRSV